ncbi:outer membrane beta-barrel protein [Roseicella aerolata]|uniref:Outer membrane beta-barrel protein n=1 Tax=Roseicella aerolata TaxID=2883479 RepID=A0A9X1IAY9_9PROT|nr:outer membrane beta-barrel protein [Roseicella aerolata]MCB4821072.1 outer membrane beta-barrel protein [Roseicella aerolata]
MVIRIREWAAGALILAALPAADAFAQPAGGISREDVQRGVTVESRLRRDYEPLGVRLGGFRLNGQLDLGGGYDDNIRANNRRRTSDGFTDQAGTVSLTSDWTTHAVGITGNFDARQYFGNSDFNWADWDIGAFGRYDLSTTTNVEGRYRHYRDHLDVYSFDVQTAGVFQPVPFSSDEFQFNANTTLNRIGLLGTALYRTYRFEDVNIGGVQNRVSLNDFDTVIGAIGTSYAFAQGRYANLIFRVQDIAYTQQESRGRDSFTWEVLGGFTYDFDGVWQARIAFGWRERNYKDPNLKNLQGPAVEGQLTWAPTLLTTLRLDVSRTIEESIRRDTVSFNRTQGGLSVDHEFLRNVILSADARADYREYQNPNESAFDALFTLSTRYLINRNLSLVGSYTHSRRLEATRNLPEYDRNLIQLRLRIAL